MPFANVIKGGEAVEYSLINTMAAHLPAELDQVWTNWGDIATVPEVHPAQYYAGRVDSIPEYPAIVAHWMSSRETDHGQPLFGQQTHIVELTAIVASDTLPVLDKQAKRYIVAMWEVVQKYPGLDGSISGLVTCLPIEAGQSKVYSKVGLLYMAVSWLLEVNTIEST